MTPYDGIDAENSEASEAGLHHVCACREDSFSLEHYFTGGSLCQHLNLHHFKEDS